MVSFISPGSHVVREPIITNISLLACDGNNFKDFRASSKEFCNEGSPDIAVWLKDCISYKIWSDSY